MVRIPPSGSRRIATVVVLLVASIAIVGCQQSGQSRYGYQEVGKVAAVQFGTVVAVRPIDITGKNTGLGAAAGGAGGGIAGSAIGKGAGNAGAILGGVIVGAVAGALIEQSVADREGLEYTITLANGKTITIAQERNAEDQVFNPGDRVMVQISGRYQRVLPANNLPTEIARPKGIEVVD